MIRRSSSPRRSTTPTRKTRVRKVNKKRKAKNALRANGDAAHKAWLHDQQCAICGWIGLPEEMEEMHVKGGGEGRKADVEFTIPACGPHWVWKASDPSEGCHRESHRGQKSFAKKHAVDLLELAAQTQARYAEHCARVSQERTPE